MLIRHKKFAMGKKVLIHHTSTVTLMINKFGRSAFLVVQRARRLHQIEKSATNVCGLELDSDSTEVKSSQQFYIGFKREEMVFASAQV